MNSGQCIENRRYKSEHLIITSRFTNAIAFNGSMAAAQQLVGTDSGLKFYICIFLLLFLFAFVLSHQIHIQWCTLWSTYSNENAITFT